MTALELLKQGYVFERDDTGLVVGLLGPPGVEVPAEVYRQVSHEIARRVPGMLVPACLPVPRDGGMCDCCGDPMARGRNGWCEFCHKARLKALDAKAKGVVVEVPGVRRAG